MGQSHLQNVARCIQRQQRQRTHRWRVCHIQKEAQHILEKEIQKEVNRIKYVVEKEAAKGSFDKKSRNQKEAEIESCIVIQKEAQHRIKKKANRIKDIEE